MTHSCLYEGIVRHRRTQPVRHEFRYRLYLAYLDLSELPELFDGRWLWSARRVAAAWFRRADHLGSPEQPLDETVRELVLARIGRRPSGPIRLLTNLRYFGFQMNPISLFYCFDEQDERLDAVVAEVNNTPWNERHCYVLDMADRQQRGRRRVRHPKELHVSPFFSMNLDYDWRLTSPGERLTVHIGAHESHSKPFDATLSLRRVPFDRWQAGRVLVQYPWMTAKVFAGIYLQAFRIWRKGVPFVPHPGRVSPPVPLAERAWQQRQGTSLVEPSK